MALATYDEIADWYAEYVDGEASEFGERVAGLLHSLVPKGNGICIDIACGTGVRAKEIRQKGWTPIGVDISLGQLKHAESPKVAGDATRLPFKTASADVVTSILCHTDVPDYRAVMREAARVTRGLFVHIGVHPAFVGAFADRTDPHHIVVDDGYHRRERRWDSFTPKGVRAKVGAWHTPISELFNAITDAGLTIARVEESGNAVPDMLGILARK